MSEFVTIGEPLVVFGSTQVNQSIVDATNFDKGVGGAELNVAIGVKRLEHQVTYISQVGDDPQGQFILKKIRQNGLETDHLTKTKKYLTGYQMKQLVSQGDPAVFNFRKNSAAAQIEISLLQRLDLTQVKLAHLTGIFPALSATTRASSFYLAKRFNQAGITLTFDPNLRPALWQDTQEMRTVLNELASYADIILPGQNEGKILTGSDDPETICDFYLNNSQTKAVFLKVGAKGAYVKTKTDQSGQFVTGFPAKRLVDTVGAGDGFAVGVITALLEHKSVLQAAQRGNAIGCLQVQVAGDNSGYPNTTELANFYQEMGIKDENN